MKSTLKHITSYFFLSGLMFVLSLQAFAQPAPGTRIDNVASLRFEYGNGIQQTILSDTARSIVEGWGGLSLNKTVSRDTATVGDTVQFKIVIRYNGNLGASNVVLSDTVPSHFRVIGSTKGTVSGNIVTWNIASVTSSTPDSVVITAVIKLLENGTYRAVNTAYATDSTGTIPSTAGVMIIIGNRVPDVLLEKTAIADTLHLGDILPFRITGKNIGNAFLQSVQYIDTLPKSLQYIGSSDPAATEKRGVVTLNKSSMYIGDSLSFIIYTRIVNIDPEVRTIINTVYLSAVVPIDSLNKPVKGGPDATTILIGRAAAAAAVVVFNPSATIIKSVDKDSVAVGDTIQYRIVVKNTGDTPMPNTVISDTINAEKMTVIAVSSNIRVLNGIVKATYDTLRVGDSAVVSIRAIITSKSANGYTNTAYVQSQVTNEQYSSVLTHFKQPINPAETFLKIEKSVSRDTVVNGDSVQFAIRVQNTGNVTLNNVIVTDTLPLQLTKNVVLYGNGSIDGNIVTYYAGSLEPHQTDSVIIVSVVNGSPYVPERITNRAYAQANDITPRYAEASLLALVGKLDKLLLHMTVSSPTVFTGDSLNYVLRVTNISNRKLTNVVVRDPVPFQLENIRVEHPNSSVRPNAKLSVVSIEESGMSVDDSLLFDGSVVIFKKDTIDVGEVDSFYVKTNVKLDRPNFELILNTGYATTDQTPQIIAQAVTLIEPRTSKNFQMQMTKRVSKDTVHIGDTLSYVIHLKNITGSPLTKITVVDTLPVQIINPRVIGNGRVENGVVIYELGILGPSKEDSIIIIGQLDPYNIHDGELVLNYAFARAFQIEEQTAYALFVAKTDPACRIEVVATPEKIIGNGKSKAYIEVRLTNTLGYPKPDGTPVVLTTTVGQFSNGQSMRVLYSKDGIVSDSLRATVAGQNLVNAIAIASADDGQGCKAKDTVFVVFFPGAIEGTVIDHRTQLPVMGAMVRAYSLTTDSLVGEKLTTEDGHYLFPVAKTDSFRVTITTTNEFGRQTTVQTNVTVTVSGAGDPPTPNNNSVSGAVYYLVSHEPVPAANLSIVLQSITPLGKGKDGTERSILLSSIDSVYTDSSGMYKFDEIPNGRFLITLNHPLLRNSVELSNTQSGQYIINANIAVVLNPNLEFKKSGPSRVAIGDTASYKIRVLNKGTLSTTNTVVIDSLHSTMIFVGASDGGVYEKPAHRIVWNIGKLDSQAIKEFDVKVRFVDTLINSTRIQNRASITSNQTTMMLDTVPTLVVLPPTMKMWKVSNVHLANPGDTVIYSINVKNLSGSFGDSISISDNLPKQVQYLGYNARYYRLLPQTVINDSVSYSSATHSINWKRDTMFVGDSAVIDIITRVRLNLEAGEHTYTNVAAMSWNGGSLTSDQDSLSNTVVRSFVSYLKITKQALRKVVEIGDIATYVVRVTNMSPSNYARDIQVVDKIPFGFRYIEGSSFIDTMKIADPVGRKELLWLLRDSLPAGGTIQFIYRLVVGAGAAEGNGINTAQAFGVSQFGNAMVSAEVAERVEVRRGVFSTHGLIIGKVFYDDNRNRYQDEGEKGVKGIELMMEDGTRIITGDDGKYSVPDVLPGEHVIRVRTHTLPKDASLEMGYNDFAKDSTSRFVNLTESGIARVDFYLVRNNSKPDSLVLRQAVTRVGNLSIQRIASPRNILFIEDQRMASMKLTGLNFEVGNANLKPEAYVVLSQLAQLLREYPNQPLLITGHTDSMDIGTVEYPNNTVLSMARAMAAKYYLVEREGISVDRIRVEGYGESRPVAVNASVEGRSLNRRVEFEFMPAGNGQQRSEIPVVIEIPISYSGPEDISKIDFRDVLHQSMTYVAGSATFGDSTVHPVAQGNELHWTLKNLGREFSGMLRYTVMVQRPMQTATVELPSSSTSICYFVGDSAIRCFDTLTTTNKAAVAVRGNAAHFVMSGVLFDIGKATLRSSAVNALETTADFLRNNPSATALIEGHTDSSPIHTVEFPSNVELSIARATTIKSSLVENFGIAPERLQIAGFGEYRPLTTNYTDVGRQVNRRIELRIVRSEFAQTTMEQGEVDSSKRVVVSMLPKNSPQGLDSLMKDKSKERYILKLEIERKEKRNTVSTMILDTVPNGLSLVKNSVTKLRGVDSVIVNGKVLIVYCSSSDSTIQLYYLAEVSDDAKEEAILMDDYTVRKIQGDGSMVEEKTASTVIEIKKKRFMARNQR